MGISMTEQGSASELTLAGTRVMVVEDSPSARKLMQELLLRLGATLPDLRLSSTVGESLQLFTQWRPQVVFVDLELRTPPDLTPAQRAAQPVVANAPKDGVELALHFRSRDPAVRIIVCSASEPDGTPLAELVRQGKVEAIVKPILAARLQEVLRRVLPRSAARPRRPGVGASFRDGDVLGDR